MPTRAYPAATTRASELSCGKTARPSGYTVDINSPAILPRAAPAARNGKYNPHAMGSRQEKAKPKYCRD